MSRVFVIAEAGINHNGDFETAVALIACAAEAGADAIKFQTYDAERLEPPGPRRDMLARYALPRDWHYPLKNNAEACGIEFMSTPFDVDSLKFLVEKVGVQRLKIASGNLDNWPLLDAARATELPVYLSTGGASLQDIKAADTFFNHNGGTDRLTLMHCVSAYPCPPEEANLRAIAQMDEAVWCDVGYSDHTLGPEAAVMAVALGASVIEKHFTLDTEADGPDHATSMPVRFLPLFVEMLREAEKLRGDGVKRVMPCEAAALDVFATRKAWREMQG